MGKSALLEYVAGTAADLRVARAVGVESEMELAFASVHQLCAPLLDRLEVLTGPQRDALEIAFGLRAGTAPDRFLIGLAVLAEVAEERPLLCVVDDAQWLDRPSAQVLAFAARRLLAEPVGLIFAAREPGEQFRGLADLEIRGLADQEARALLRSAARFRLDERVQDRILAEADGNPLALLELPHGLDPARQTYVDAWQAGVFAGYLAGAGDLVEVSRAARALPPPAHPPRPVDLLLDGLALMITDGPPCRCSGRPRPPSPAPAYPCKKACSGAGWSGSRTGRCGMRRAGG